MFSVRSSAGLQPRLSLFTAFLLLYTAAAAAQTSPERQHAVDTFNAANKAYSAAQYETAAPLYEQVIVALPDQPIAYLYLGNSYDHLSLNAPRGSKEIIELAHKAEANYRLAANKLLALEQPNATKNVITALEMLAALYAPDRLHDGVAARDVMEKLIALTPGDPSYVFSLAKLEENVEDYDAAVAALDKALQLAPDDAKAWAEVAGHYWDIATHGVKLTRAREQGFIEKGMTAADRALALAPDNAEATAYKGQLIREQAEFESDKRKKDALIKEAGVWAAKAKALRAASPSSSSVPLTIPG